MSFGAANVLCQIISSDLITPIHTGKNEVYSLFRGYYMYVFDYMTLAQSNAWAKLILIL